MRDKTRYWLLVTVSILFLIMVLVAIAVTVLLLHERQGVPDDVLKGAQAAVSSLPHLKTPR